MASTEHLIVQPLESSLSTPPSSCKKRPNPHLHIFDLLPPSPKRHSSSSSSSSSSEYPSASPVSSASPSSSSSSSSYAFSSASSFQLFDECLSELDASCFVELDETDPNMSSTQQELLSEMMKTLEKVLEDGNLQKSAEIEAALGMSTPLSPSPSPLSRSTVCGMDNNSEENQKAVENQSCELVQISALSENRKAAMACADFPFDSCNNRSPKLVGDSSDELCSTSSDCLELSELPSEEGRGSEIQNVPHRSRLSTEEDECFPSDLPEGNSEIDRLSPSHASENIVHREIEDHLLDEAFGQSEEAHDSAVCTLRYAASSEACDELLRDLLAEATGSDLIADDPSSTAAFTYGASGHEIEVDEWPLLFDNEGTDPAGSSESDNHALECCSFSYEDESCRDVLFNSHETALF